MWWDVIFTDIYLPIFLHHHTGDERNDNDSDSLSLYEDCEGDTNSIKSGKGKMRIIRLQDEAQYIDDLENGLFV